MVEKYFDDYMYTKKEFESYISHMCETDGIGVNYILTDQWGKEYNYGQRGEGEAQKHSIIGLKNNYKVKVEIWGKKSDINIEEYECVFKEYWNSSNTDNTTGFPTTEQLDIITKCNNTIKHHLEGKNKIALIMADLDHFKDVNDNNNHTVGSRVLGEFSQLLFSVFGDKGIIIHQSGDEFNIIFPYEEEVQIVQTVKEARDIVKKHEFRDVKDLDLSMAVGVKCINDEFKDFMTERNEAEKIYNDSGNRNSTKQRDSIRINNLQTISYGKNNIKLGWTRLICNLDCSILGNVYLEYIRKYAQERLDMEDFQNHVEEIINWINPEWEKSNYALRITAVNNSFDSKAKFSELELCLAITQGLLKNPHFEQENIVFKSNNDYLEILKEGKPIFRRENNCDVPVFEGQCEDYYRKQSSKNCKRAVLVQAGYDNASILEGLFYRVIYVDTRPATGGGLPDFWAATMCELLTIFKENSMISDILIYGNVEYTTYIVELLESIDNWETSEKYKYISQKTFKPIEDIQRFKNKYENHIFFCKSECELYNKVCEVYKKQIQIEVKDSLSQEIKKRRILDRNLSYKDIQLDISDGCRVETIADAYPIVLEILRHQRGKSNNCIKDQAGRELLELIDFKIVLSNPKSSDLPDYYVYEEQLLKDYYDKILGAGDSLFRKKLIQNKQLDAMIFHIMQAINEDSRYATRRAILVVPNEVQDEENYSPLGLISIWLAPRFFDDKIIIDFSYNWRTVEAVVGLPLSMYASVRFAEELREMIREKTNSINYHIELGTVSYIAHSLHMFLDIESMDIVRGIINDASI